MLGKLIKLLTHRLFITIIMLLIQIFFVIYAVLIFEESFILIYLITQIIGILLVLKIISSEINPGYKIALIITILIIPVFGTLFYLIFSNKNEKKVKKRLKNMNALYEKHLIQNEEVLEIIKNENLDAYNQINYLTKVAKFPVYNNTSVEYFKIGEEYYEKLIEELKKAKQYIFLEYFIIEHGYMWDNILKILKEKVKEGVEVRVIYDDMGCIITLPNKYYKELAKYGIKCCSFNKFIPILNFKLNSRDHRKIVVIDGIVGFTGGINLADEYINEKERFGHWKDNGIMLKGEAVWSLAIMFLNTWNHMNNKKDKYSDFKPKLENTNYKGYVQPYNDTPLDDEPVGQTVYLNLINKTKKYIYIMTPYLVIDNELETSLKNAAKSGIDVRIIVPGIPDKKTVNELTKAYYNNLIESGVKIYEYTKGFIHAKTFLVDSIYAAVGTINLDYRSLYLLFECGVLLYKTKCISDIEKDFEETLKECKKIKLSDTKVDFLRKLKRAILRLFAPLV